MLWDPGSVEKDGKEETDNAPVSPILVPLQNNPASAESSIPLLVPDVQDLKDQFQHQQNILTQIKETLKQNESQLSSKEKQVEVYANKLSQIRARSKNTKGKKAIAKVSPDNLQSTLTKTSPQENLEKLEGLDSNSKVERRGKISELKKCLEENKIKFEQRTGKEQTETKKIESLVEQLKMQVIERDKTIQGLQKDIEASTIKTDTLPKKSKKKLESVASKTTQTNRMQPSDNTNEEVTALQNKIFDLETRLLDLQENIKEKESVIEARTQAVTLLSQDFSLKEKNTWDNLEETRQEMRAMQTKFVAIEDQLKKDLVDRDNRLVQLNEKYNKLESINFELSLKNAELQEKIVNLQKSYAEVESERSLLKESMGEGRTNERLDELMKKVNALTKELDDRNKSMIKMKLEHKNKIKNLTKVLETLKETSNEKAEIIRLNNVVEEFENIKTKLENRVAELEDEKGNLLLSVLDVDDLKATEAKLKDQIKDLETLVKNQNEDLTLHLHAISKLEKEKLDLVQANQDQIIVIENLYAKIQGLESGAVNADESLKIAELSRKLQDAEAEYNRKVENLKAEHCKEIEMLESIYSSSKIETVDRKELDEYRISTEINNIHVEEQIELLIREKQQLLEKLKSLSGVSSTDSLTFEKMEHSDLKDDEKEAVPQLEGIDVVMEKDGENRISHLQRIINDQQYLINELQKTIDEEKQKAKTYQNQLGEMEGTIKRLEDVNAAFKKQFDTVEVAEPGQNQKSNLNAKNRIKKIEMELTEAKITIEQQNEKLKDLNLKLEEKENLIKKYTEKIELFEKDDWDRQNHWKNVGDDIEDVQELQKKCLSLENSLIELNEDCERLRKENIEVVHRLSVEKVKRRKLIEEIRSRSRSGDSETQPKSDSEAAFVEEKLNIFIQHISDLEKKVESLESIHAKAPAKNDFEESEEEKWEKAELLQKIEWSNVVLSGKETEIFELQNLLENRNKMMEDLQMDLKEWKENLFEKEKTLNQLNEKLRAKEMELEEISSNFNRLQEFVDAANEKTAANESQLQKLLTSLKDMEGDVFVKESELQQIKATLAEKNNDIESLKTRLEEVNCDLTHSYQDHLDNMGKCLRDKELEYDALLAEKQHLNEVNESLKAEKDEIYVQKTALAQDKEQLQQMLNEKDKEMAELKLKIEGSATAEGKDKNPELEDMKIKMKKLAANLKKKAQNEKDLLQQVKDLEAHVAEKEKIAQKLQEDVNEISEKWALEQSEKEQIRTDMAALEEDRSGLKNQLLSMENEIKNNSLMHEGQVRLMEDEIQKAYETCNRLQMCEQQYKDTIVSLEAQVHEMSKFNQNVAVVATENQQQIEEDRKAKEALLKNLAEITGKYEKLKFDFDQLLLEKSELVKQCEELQNLSQGSILQNSGLDAKLQENFAVIENLEEDLRKAQDYIKSVEEKFFISEERRMSLESKNEEMSKKIIEDSQSSVTIEELAQRVDELLKSEKSLQDFIKSLENENVELKQTLDELQSEKMFLEKEVKVLTERTNEAGEELHQLKDSDLEKTQVINNLTMEVKKEKAEQKQVLKDFEKLNKDYEQFENDYKESLEKSQELERSLRQKIEELTNENSFLKENVTLLSEDKTDVPEKVEKPKEEEKPKKRKSVTFRTDDVEYIKDLKSELHRYDENLKLANEQIETLKEELFREKLKSEVTNVVKEAQEKVENLINPEKILGPAVETEVAKMEMRSLGTENPEKIFAPVVEVEVAKVEMRSLGAENPVQEERKFDANVFFGSKSSKEDNSFFSNSLLENTFQNSESEPSAWDEDSGWGVDGQLEEAYLSEKASNLESAKPEMAQAAATDHLQEEIERLKQEIERLSKKLQEQEEKYTKALKKLKEQKIICDKMETEMKNLKSNSGFGDLEAAILDELKSQIQSMESKEKELIKNHKIEKENLLKKIEVLNVGNEKFLEMKERQDNEAEMWQRRNNELLKEIAELRHEMSNSQAPQWREGGESTNGDALLEENKELKNKIEALEWKNCELTELLEEKQELLEGRSGNDSEAVEKVIQEKSVLQKEVEELNNVKELLEKKLLDEEKKNSTAIVDLNEQLSALATENETLQDILNKMKESSDAAKKDKNTSDSKIFDYFKSSAVDDFLPAASVVEQPSSAAAPMQQQLSSPVKVADQAFGENSFKQKLFELQGDLLCETGQSNEREIHLETMIGDEIVATMELQELERKMASLEEYIKIYNELYIHTRDLNAGKRKAVEELKEKLLQVQSSQEPEASILLDKLAQIENFMRLREEKVKMLKQKYENQAQILKMQIYQKEKGAQAKAEEFSHFETIDLNQKSDPLVAADNESDILKERLFELEEMLKLKEEELARIQLTFQQNVENEKQRAAELENLLQMKEEELRRLNEFSGRNQIEWAEITKQTQELKDAFSVKENEYLQDQSLKLKEIQQLKEENYGQLQTIENMQMDFKATLFQLGEEARYREEEVKFMESVKANEIQELMQRKNELENILTAKSEEIGQLTAKLNDLEKSYNDSKIEIERLLNEEKLNTEEKFVETFQKNIQIPVAFEVEALSRTLAEEKQKVDNLQYELGDKSKVLLEKTEEIQELKSKIIQLENRMQEMVDEEGRQKMNETYESFQVKNHYEQMVANLQKDLENVNYQLSNKSRELEELRIMKEETLSHLKSQLIEVETELTESTEKKDAEIAELRAELQEKAIFYDTFLATKKDDETKMEDRIEDLGRIKKELESKVEALESELRGKENIISDLSQTLSNERSQMAQVAKVLQEKESEVVDLRETSTHLRDEISHFRNFEKQVKELRVAHLQESGSEMPVNDEGDPDFSDWTEHELAELSSRLQSDLDTALYMLHQRDVRCDELTFELMQLLEERDTLQLRLSTALRINEELRSMRVVDNNSSNSSLKENKDLVDQSNDRQEQINRVPSEDLQQLASKISELHSVSYLRDKTIKDDSFQRHSDQMTLLSRISDSDISLTRNSQSSSAVLLNWVRGKTTPKVMHI